MRWALPLVVVASVGHHRLEPPAPGGAAGADAPAGRGRAAGAAPRLRAHRGGAARAGARAGASSCASTSPRRSPRSRTRAGPGPDAGDGADPGGVGVPAARHLGGGGAGADAAAAHHPVVGGAARRASSSAAASWTADPALNVRLGVRYLKYLKELFRGRLDLALMAYNAGPQPADRPASRPATPTPGTTTCGRCGGSTPLLKLAHGESGRLDAWRRATRWRHCRAMSDGKSLQETYAPHNACFGCGPANEKGLRIRSFVGGRRGGGHLAARAAPRGVPRGAQRRHHRLAARLPLQLGGGAPPDEGAAARRRLRAP